MKKMLIAMLTLCLCLGACASAQPRQVGIVQLVENGAFNDMRQGFADQVRALGYGEDQIAFTYQNASGDMSNLYAICQGFAGDDMAAVITIATPASQAMVNLESGIPVFFIAVSNPLGAGIISDMAAPDKNATGTSNAIPVDEMFKLSDQLTPGVTTYGLLYCASQVNSVSTIESAKAYLDGASLGYVEAVVSSTGEVYEAALSLVEQGVGAIFVPNDSVIQDAMEVVAQVAKDAAIPVYGSSAVMVRSGALATVSISDRAIGALTADMFVKHLQGTPIDQIPAVVVDQFTTVINTDTAQAIGVALPQQVTDGAQLIAQ